MCSPHMQPRRRDGAEDERTPPNPDALAEEWSRTHPLPRLRELESDQGTVPIQLSSVLPFLEVVFAWTSAG